MARLPNLGINLIYYLKNMFTVNGVLEGGDKFTIQFVEESSQDDAYTAFREAVEAGELFNLEGWNGVSIEIAGESFTILNAKKVLAFS